jgi:hypothetical protein
LGRIQSHAGRAALIANTRQEISMFMQWKSVTLVITMGALGFVPESMAQSAATDPWKKVPATTSCFTDDGFVDRLHQLRAEMESAIERQNALNDSIKARYDAMDMNERMSRMQAYMMRNPQAAARMIEAGANVGEQAAALMPELQATAERLQKELTRQQALFRDEVDKAVNPILARQKQLADARVGEDQRWASKADFDQYAALVAQENAEYEKVCNRYFGANAPFPRHLAAYRKDILDQQAALAKSSDAGLAMQFAFMDTPTTGYRSTVDLKNVRDYAMQAVMVYSVRRNKSVARGTWRSLP